MSTFAVLLHTAAENLEPECGPANYALGLAAALEAHLTGLVFQLEVALPGSAYGALGQADLNATFESATAVHCNEPSNCNAARNHAASQWRS